MRVRTIFGWVLLVLCLGWLATPVLADRSEANGNAGNPGVLPPNSSPHGHSYAEWTESLWQWMASIPLDVHPGLDETGANIGQGQSGSVWYLLPNFTGATSVRTGCIPSGKALCIALIAMEASTREGYGTTEEELRAAAAGIIDGVENLTCEVDGVSLQNLDRYRFQSAGMFSLTVPEDNVFDLWGVPTDAGTYYPSVSDGYYVMLAPLAAGEHTIHFHGEIPMIGYAPDITYHLTVAGQPQRSPGADGDTDVTSWGAIKAAHSH